MATRRIISALGGQVPLSKGLRVFWFSYGFLVAGMLFSWIAAELAFDAGDLRMAYRWYYAGYGSFAAAALLAALGSFFYLRRSH